MPPADAVRQPWFLRSRSRLALTLAAVLLVPIGAMVALAHQVGGGLVREQALERCRSMAELGAVAVTTFLDGACAYVDAYAGRRLVVDAAVARDEEAMRAQLAQLVEGNARIGRAFVTDPEGVEWSDWPSDPAVLGVSFAHRDWFRGVSQTGRAYVSEVYRRAARPPILLVAIATPVRAPAGEVRAYLVAQVPVEMLAEWVSAARPGPQGSLAMVDATGRAITPGALLDGAEPPRLDARLRAQAGEAATAWIGPDPLGTQACVLSLRATDRHGWSVLARLPLAAVEHPVGVLALGLVGLAGVLLLVLFLLGLRAFGAARQHAAALRALQDSKDQLALTIVHDLRNPLTAIQGNLDLAASGPGLDPGVKTSLDQAAGAARRLTELVNTLVDVVRLEDGRLPLDVAPCDLAAVARATAAQYRARAERGGVEVKVQAPAEAVTVRADPAVLTRIIENLMSNALKHTPPGGRVRLAAGPRAQGGGELVVEDTGEGIAPEELPRLFTKYGRVAGQQRRTRHDTGLGLVFCRLAVEAQGGSIRAESRPGAGARFVVELPGGAGPAPSPGARTSAPPGGLG